MVMSFLLLRTISKCMFSTSDVKNIILVTAEDIDKRQREVPWSLFTSWCFHGFEYSCLAALCVCFTIHLPRSNYISSNDRWSWACFTNLIFVTIFVQLEPLDCPSTIQMTHPLQTQPSESILSSAFLAVTVVFSSKSCQLPKSPPKHLSFWPYLGTYPAYAWHAVCSCLQPIKSSCFCLCVQLPWCQSQGLEDPHRSF